MVETTHENAVFVLKSTGQDVKLKISRNLESAKVPVESTQKDDQSASITGIEVMLPLYWYGIFVMTL